jgi:uncharacterized repeat protein (TIGR03806 family)
MKNNFPLKPALAGVLFFLILGCSKNDDNYQAIPESPVVADLTLVPYTNLSTYQFFQGELKDMNPSYGVLPYRPASELFTDYALKKRFVWLPKGTKATYDGDGKILQLPVGAALLKTFYYEKMQPLNDTRILETRVMIKKASGWIVAEYVWNAAQTDAILQTTSASIPISWMDEANVVKSTTYKIPSSNECTMCHNNNLQTFPIGIKPQNLNTNYNYAEGTKNQLQKWIAFGYLENNLPANIVSTIDYKDSSQPLNLRVRSYFDINCAHCHQDGGYASFYALRFPFSQTTTLANMGVCLTPNHVVPGVPGRIVTPSDITHSILFYRVSTTETGYRMPFLGRTIVHEEGVQLIKDWINSITECE